MRKILREIKRADSLVYNDIKRLSQFQSPHKRYQDGPPPIVRQYEYLGPSRKQMRVGIGGVVLIIS